MARVALNERLFVFDDVVAVEYGAVYKTEIATEELLSDTKTASHYVVGAPDAAGNEIVLGQPMTYVDWLGDHAWFVYRLTAVPEDEVDARGATYWELKGYRETQDEAEAFALTLI